MGNNKYPNKNPNENHATLLSEKDPDWIRNTHHDYLAALRSFEYLISKFTKIYEQSSDPLAEEKIISMRKHLKTLETIKKDVIDQVIPL